MLHRPFVTKHYQRVQHCTSQTKALAKRAQHPVVASVPSIQSNAMVSGSFPYHRDMLKYSRFNARSLHAEQAQQSLLRRTRIMPSHVLGGEQTPLANLGFSDIESLASLQDLHRHLTERYAFFERVMYARKLHRSKFFSLSLDSGH